MRNLYVFGNEFLEEDRKARELSSMLEGFNVVHCRSPDELLECEEDEILILDVVSGIKKPMIITDIEQIKTTKMLSLHDFDLGFFLKLMKEMGMDKKIKIIGIPPSGDLKKIKEEIKVMT